MIAMETCWLVIENSLRSWHKSGIQGILKSKPETIALTLSGILDLDYADVFTFRPAISLSNLKAYMLLFRFVSK